MKRRRQAPWPFVGLPGEPEQSRARKIGHFIRRCWERLDKVLNTQDVEAINEAIAEHLGDPGGPVLIGVHNDALIVQVPVRGTPRVVIYDQADRTVVTVVPGGDGKCRAWNDEEMRKIA